MFLALQLLLPRLVVTSSCVKTKSCRLLLRAGLLVSNNQSILLETHFLFTNQTEPALTKMAAFPGRKFHWLSDTGATSALNSSFV